MARGNRALSETVITSTTNGNVKQLRALYRDRKNRYACGEYVAEGATMVKDIPSELIKKVFVRESEFDKLASLVSCERVYSVKDEIFDGVADTKSPSGIAAIVAMPKENAIDGELVVLLCGVSDAGNVGTIMRTACACGVTSVICADTADPYSPKAVRASMGAIAKLNVVQTSLENALKLSSDYRLAALDMGGESIFGYKKSGKIMLAVGNEAHGVPREIIERAADIIAIPMTDKVESLNASVAAGIAMYIIKNDNRA